MLSGLPDSQCDLFHFSAITFFWNRVWLRLPRLNGFSLNLHAMRSDPWLAGLEVANDCHDESCFPCVSRNVTPARRSQAACAVLWRWTGGVAADGNLWSGFEPRIFLKIANRRDCAVPARRERQTIRSTGVTTRSAGPTRIPCSAGLRTSRPSSLGPERPLACRSRWRVVSAR